MSRDHLALYMHSNFITSTRVNPLFYLKIFIIYNNSIILLKLKLFFKFFKFFRALKSEIFTILDHLQPDPKLKNV